MTNTKDAIERPQLAILRMREAPDSPVEQKRRQLAALLSQREAAATRLRSLREAVDIAVSLRLSGNSERERLRAAIAAQVALDKQITELGAEVKQLDGIG
jgi:hypothetical protein